MPKFLGYRCSLCGADLAPDPVVYACPRDGGNLEVVLDWERIRRRLRPDDVTSRLDPSLWRYEPLLPVTAPDDGATPFHAAGWTPVYEVPRLAAEAGLRRVWVKDESRNPSGSLKDRASAVVLRRAQEVGAETVVTASTGNAGAALACMAASLGRKAVILAPRTAPPAKVAQLLVFGAKVVLVDGTYDDAFDLTVEAAREFGWYCRNTGMNPFTAEGKKTAAYEVWEWWREARLASPREVGRDADRARLSVFVSVGDGNIVAGLHKGFRDLVALGWMPGLPRLFGVQAEGSSAVARAFAAGTEAIAPVRADTIADSISVDLPRDGVRAVRAVRETGGAYLVVSDDEILRAVVRLGSAGVFAEPAGAAAWAGVVRAAREGLVGADDLVLALNTGSGLKDVKAAMRAAGDAPVVEPTLAALKRVL